MTAFMFLAILLILVVGFMLIACFYVGAKVGQQVSKGEPIETPTLNPMEALRESAEKRAAKKAAEKEQERINTIMQNIESYDGTGNGQRDVLR